MTTDTASVTEAELRDLVQRYSEAQVRAAFALIAVGRIHPVPGLDGTFVAESSDNVTRYLCDRFGACQCPGHRRTGRCKHGLAARLLDVNAKAAA